MSAPPDSSSTPPVEFYDSADGQMDGFIYPETTTAQPFLALRGDPSGKGLHRAKRAGRIRAEVG